jgi:hypothetical protein
MRKHIGLIEVQFARIVAPLLYMTNQKLPEPYNFQYTRLALLAA